MEILGLAAAGTAAGTAAVGFLLVRHFYHSQTSKNQICVYTHSLSVLLVTWGLVWLGFFPKDHKKW